VKNLVSSNGDLVWVEDRQIRILPNQGGTSRQVLGNLGQVESIAADSDFVYYTDFETGKVAKVGKDGTGLTALAVNQDRLRAVAVTDTKVYWRTVNKVWSVPKQ
jgi:hypothetical protein